MLRLVIALALLSPFTFAAARPPQVVAGLDHTPVAVRDLDAAAADFARLGFVIKPGRLHTDGIRNKHIKFPNGGGIELITASSPTDALAAEYVDWLKDGDGPAFWSLYSPDLGALTEFLSRRKLAPRDAGDVVTFSQNSVSHRLFFANRLRSPTDGPLYWAHPNTAYRFAGVWLAGTAGDQQIIAALGATPSQRSQCAPFSHRVGTFVLPGEGDSVMVARDIERPQARSIIGLTVLVARLAATRSVLRTNHVHFIEPVACAGHSIWVGPTEAHGAWLEFHTGNAAAAK